ATFVGFRMYQNIFDPTRPWTAIIFVGIAAAGMASALILYHLSNSEVAQGDRLVKLGRHQEALVHYERAIRMVRRPSYAWTSRGCAMKYLGRLNDALRCHENAIRLDPFRGLESLGHAAEELPVAVPLKDLDQQAPSRSKRPHAEGEGRLRQIEGAGDVHGAMPAELGGHVADDDVGGSAKSLEELRLHLGILKVAAEELDAFQRNERGEVHREHAAGRADPL